MAFTVLPIDDAPGVEIGNTLTSPSAIGRGRRPRSEDRRTDTDGSSHAVAVFASVIHERV